MRRGGHREAGDMLIECRTCTVRGHTCSDCVVTALWALEWPGADASPVAHTSPAVDPDPGLVPLDANEWRAVDVLVRAGLVDPAEASGLGARPETWRRHQAVG